MSSTRGSPFGEILKRYRAAWNLTQEELAERARLSVRGISDLERGVNHTPRRETILALADALNLSAPQREAFERAAISADRSSRAQRPVWQFGARQHLPIIGRAREVALIEALLRGDAPPLLVFAGEPGIGKSRLLTEAVRRAGEEQFEVLAAGCLGRGGQDPFSPLLAALERYIARLPSVRRTAALHTCEWLARLLPELAGATGLATPAWTLSPEQERRLIFAAVARFLSSAANGVGVVLVLDDLQWAQQDALDLLAHLLRSETDPPIRVIAAYRDTEVRPGDPLSLLLTDLVRDRMAVRAPLGPLSRDASDELLRLASTLGADSPDVRSGAALAQTPTAPSAKLVDRILERAGGVPLFLVSCSQTLRGSAEEQDGSIPWDVAEVLRQRIAKLPEAAREVLEVAAMIGREVPLNLLSVVANHPETLGEGLAAACAERLLIDSGDDVYQFAHDLISEVVAAELGSARRALLHRRIAESLEHDNREPRLERLAYHYARSGDTDRAAYFLERAGDRAQELHAFADAETYYRDALSRFEQLNRPNQATAIREKLGLVLMTTARYDEAFGVFADAATIYEAADNLDGVGRVVTQIGWGEVRRGTPARGLERIHRFLDQCGNRTVKPETRIGLLMVQAFLCFVNGRYEEQLAIDEKIVECVRPLGDTRISAQAEAHRSLALNMLGRYEEARQAILAVLPDLETGGDPTSLLMGLNALSVAYQSRGEFDLADRYMRLQLDICEKVGDPIPIAFVLSMHAGLLFDRGRWEQAQEALVRAAGLIHDLGACWAAPYVYTQRGILALAQGHAGDGIRDLNEAVAYSELSGDLQVRCMAEYALANNELLHGHPEQARTRLVPYVQSPVPHGIFEGYFRHLLGAATLELGDRAEASRHCDICLATARERQDRLLQIDALLLRARITSCEGNWPAAVAALDEALRTARAVGSPYGEARALFVAGSLLAERGERQAAHDRFTAALHLLSELGERAYAQRIEEILEGGKP